MQVRKYKSLNRDELPRYDTFCFFCICRTQVCNLSGLKLCQCWFPTEGPETYPRLEKDTSEYCIVWYSLPYGTCRVRSIELRERFYVFESFVVHAVTREKSNIGD